MLGKIKTENLFKSNCLNRSNKLFERIQVLDSIKHTFAEDGPLFNSML